MGVFKLQTQIDRLKGAYRATFEGKFKEVIIYFFVFFISFFHLSSFFLLSLLFLTPHPHKQTQTPPTGISHVPIHHSFSFICCLYPRRNF